MNDSIDIADEFVWGRREVLQVISILLSLISC